MITAEYLTAANEYAAALAARLRGYGLAAEARTPKGSLPSVSAGTDLKFHVSFRAESPTELRVVWDARGGRVSRAALPDNVNVTAQRMLESVRAHNRQAAWERAQKERVEAAEEQARRLRVEYGLVEGRGDVRLQRRPDDYGAFDVTFVCGTPEKVAEVLATLREAKLV